MLYCIQDLKAPPHAIVSFLFSDTLLLPGTDWQRMTAPHSAIVSPVDDGSRFLDVVVDRGDRIIDWIDHPEGHEPALATIGIYTLPLFEWARILRLWCDIMGAEGYGMYGFLRHTSMWAVHTDAWLDTGTEESYHKACDTLRGMQ
jgi:dTDP-glucose pyrophosphorylase